jgi:hypothetical protein
MGAKKWPRRFSASAIKPLRIRFPEIYPKLRGTILQKLLTSTTRGKEGLLIVGRVKVPATCPNITPFGVLVNKKIRDL